jgi:hypothetical protein
MDYPSASNGDSSGGTSGPMVKTRSYGDLMSGCNSNSLTRRSSDPNMVESSNIITPLNISQENSIDSSESFINSTPANGFDDPVMASMIQDTTQKLQILTQELNDETETFDGPKQEVNGCGNGEVVNGDDKEIKDLEDEAEQWPIQITENGRDENSMTQNFWHGSVETSTDTLVPVVENCCLANTNENHFMYNGQCKNGLERERDIVEFTSGSLSESSVNLINKELSLGEEKCDNLVSTILSFLSDGFWSILVIFISIVKFLTYFLVKSKRD